MKPDEIERLLPWVFQRTLNNEDNPLHGFIQVMSGLHEPVEEAFGDLHDYFNPYQTPERFLPFLARMVNVHHYLSDEPPYLASGTHHLRNLIARAVPLSSERGTRQGLEAFLEIATGIDKIRVRESRRKPFHLEVHLPQEAKVYTRLIDSIMRYERPAYTTYELIQEPVSND